MRNAIRSLTAALAALLGLALVPPAWAEIRWFPAPGPLPGDLAWSPSGLWQVNHWVAGDGVLRWIQLLDPETGAVRGSFPSPYRGELSGLGGSPTGLAVSFGFIGYPIPHFVDRLFIGNNEEAGGVVYEVHASPWVETIKNQFSVPALDAVAFAGTQLYVADRNSNTILVTARDGTPIRSFEAPVHPEAMTHDASTDHLWSVSKWVDVPEPDRISEFTTDGFLIRSCAGPREGVSGSHHTGITRDFEGTFYASWPSNPEVGPGRIYVFELADLDCEVFDAPPVARAGEDQFVHAGATVRLDGSASSDAEHPPELLSYRWTQTEGIPVELADADESVASFTAPEPVSVESVSFRLTVTDPNGNFDSDTVHVTVLEDPDHAVFASSSLGDDANPGTPQAPVQSLARATEIASQITCADAVCTRSDIYLHEGVYAGEEPWRLLDDMSLYGEFRAARPDPAGPVVDWHRQPLRERPAPPFPRVLTPVGDTILEGAATALIIEGVSSPTTIEALVIRPAEGSDGTELDDVGENSIGIHVLSSSGELRITSNRIAVRQGGRGLHGDPGAPGENGRDGDSGGADGVPGLVLPGSACGREGGSGGIGTKLFGLPGQDGEIQPWGGLGGSGGVMNPFPDDTGDFQGNPGGSGGFGGPAEYAGATGDGGSGWGQVVDDIHWSGSRGEPGGRGDHGNGGGGGGGGSGAHSDVSLGSGILISHTGGGGGAGGGGGCGGYGGEGGGGGGGSIGILTVDSSALIARNHITTVGGGDAGDGGPGGQGGTGAPGGDGGEGGGTDTGPLGLGAKAGHGGVGGLGSNGAAGGSGGGGGGGLSCGVYPLGNFLAYPKNSDNSFADPDDPDDTDPCSGIGPGGNGGQPGGGTGIRCPCPKEQPEPGDPPVVEIVFPEETVVGGFDVGGGSPFMDVGVSFPGSDVVLSLVAPSGRVIGRETVAPDVSHDRGPGFETYRVWNPEPGRWTTRLFGADVPPEGEPARLAAIVEDPNQPPVAVCRDATLVAGAGCTAGASVDGGSYDPDEGETFSLRQEPAGPYALGETPVTLTVEDARGASSSCEARVVVTDETPPAITCPANVVVAPGQNVPPIGSASATDACDPSPSVGSDAPAAFPLGLTAVQWWAEDASGNVSTCSQTVAREAEPCDVNQDGVVDDRDVKAIFVANGSSAEEPFTALDVDGDGQVTVIDARTCAVACTYENCARPVRKGCCGLLGIEALLLIAPWAAARRRRATKSQS